MNLAEDIFGQMDENEKKNPLYYKNEDTLDKENKELKRSLNAMQKMKSKNSTEELLSKKDFAALEKGLIAYSNLLYKRERASQDNRRRSAIRQNKEVRGAKWIRSSFEKVDVELMLKIIYIQHPSIRLWSFYEDSIEDEFMRKLRDWGLHINTKEDAAKHVKKLYKAMNDKTHPAYKKWEEAVKDGLKEYKETLA